MRFLAFILLVFVALPVEAKSPKRVTIEFDPGISEKVSVQAAWLAYAAHLAKWATEEENARYVCRRSLQLPFEAELSARAALASGIWAKFKAKDAEAFDDYLDSLLRIEAAGFMAEYVWRYHYRSGWKEPEMLRETEFDEWRSRELPEFHAVTLSGIELDC